MDSLGRGRGRSAVSLDVDDAESYTTSSSTSEHRSRETESASSTTGTSNGRSRNRLQPHRTRPKHVNTKMGKSGRKVDLSANYFKVMKRPSFSFSLYRVDFEPDIGEERLRKVFVNRQSDYFGNMIYDGGNMIYVTHRLPDVEHQFEVTDTYTEKKYLVKIKFTGQVIGDTDSMALMIYNTMLRRAMGNLKLELVGRNLYDALAKSSLDQFRVELWPGYITSIRQHEENLLVCVEVSTKIMRQENLYEILATLRREKGDDWKEVFQKQVIGSVVLTAYNNKTYRIDDVDFLSSPMSTFKQRENDITFKDYYKGKYNLDIPDIRQPMLVSNATAADRRAGRNKPILLVPYLCRATGLTDSMRSNFTMMRALADHTQLDPEKRRGRIQALTRRIYSTPQSLRQLNSFDMDIEQDVVKFQGRALAQENVIFGADKKAPNDDRVDWTNAMKSSEMYASIPLKRWAIIYPRRCASETQEFLRLMKEVGNGMNYDVGDPKMNEIPDDRVGTYKANIEQLISKDPKMIVVVVPNNAADRYSVIKRITCVEKTIPTQVIVSKTMIPKKGGIGGVKSIATKVMIQINCKLGGAPWMINFPLKGTMTVGFDITHDTQNKALSFGAFVATMDLKQKVAFYSSALPHKDGNEISNNIEIHMIGAIKQFKETHGALPERIMFYRDGVGDGQIMQVQEQEVKRLEEKFKVIYAKFGNGVEPKFTFIIVNKRLNTRIFLNQGNRITNPASGTVVDNTITLPERYDFFLVSQSVRQGTVAPTSYNIIHDTSGLTPDQMQVISYKNTHLYYNWSGTTRVPAVVQYAHKLALLVGQSLHTPPNKSWNNQLYFL